MLTEDLTIFLDTDDHAVIANIKGVDKNVIFENEEIITLDAVINQPSITLATTDTTGLTKGDAVIINSTNYTYDYQQDDGTGLTKVILKNV